MPVSLPDDDLEREGGTLAMPQAPGLDWLLLTKRPENWALAPEDVRPLVWLGTSVSDQKTADEWAPRLLAAKGFRRRFLSVEPLVGPVDLSRWLKPVLHTNGGDHLQHPDPRIPNEGGRWEWPISWVIVGGESGSKARPLNVAWVRDIVKQCAEAGVKCFVKQLGAQPVDTRTIRGVSMAPRVDDVPMDLADPKGGDIGEWPEYVRVREVPGD
jgi:protein gp37